MPRVMAHSVGMGFELRRTLTVGGSSVGVNRFLSYFVSDWTEGIYGYPLDELRPFLAFSYWLDAHIYGPLNVSGYHITNLILHLANALLMLAIARSIAPGKPAFALLAASLFALMPSHAEPVAWISGRVDSLAALFYLGAFLCFVRFRVRNRRRWLLGALLVFACGLFAKQSLLTLPLLILAFDVMRRRSMDFSGGRSILVVAAPAVLRARGFVSGASPIAVRERRPATANHSRGDRGVLLPSEPLPS
jgi:hypothetical protein